MSSGLNFTDLAKYNWTQLGRLDKNKIPELNRTMIVQVTGDAFNKTGGLVHNCGGIGYGSFFLLKRILNIVIHGDEWFNLLRRLKDNGFDIISYLSVGFRFFDEQRFYDAGVEFGNMAKILLYDKVNLRAKLMNVYRNKQIDTVTYFRTANMLARISRRVLRNGENPSFLEVLKEIGLGLLKSLKKVAIAKESMECIKKGYEVEYFFTNITKANFTTNTGLERVVNGTGVVITSLIDECLKTPEDLFSYISRSIDFFTHLTSDKVKKVMYEDIKLFADTAIQAFKVVYEQHDAAKATELIGDVLRKVIEQLDNQQQLRYELIA